MEDLLNQLSFNFDENFSIGAYVLNIGICAVLLYILSLVYVRFGNALSNRAQLAKVIILIGVTTFIIISIVKSSLALSLGLVGALSIVRFRTAIKEPEELGYFFIAISVGLGMGANQLIPTIIGFVMLMIIIFLLSLNRLHKTYAQNLLISVPSNGDKSALTDKVSGIVINNANQVDLKRLKYGDHKIDFNFLINLNSLEKVKQINEQLLAIDQNIDITFLSAKHS